MASEEDRFTVPPVGKWGQSKNKLILATESRIYTEKINNKPACLSQITVINENQNTNTNTTDDTTILTFKSIQSSYFQPITPSIKQKQDQLLQKLSTLLCTNVHKHLIIPTLILTNILNREHLAIILVKKKQDTYKLSVRL